MASVVIDTIKAKNEAGATVTVYPRTVTSAVKNNDGKTVDTILAELEGDITTSVSTSKSYADEVVSIEKSERQTEIAVERARIDAFTALPEGSTTGDAALEDIKIKADGTTADTAGNAVREQINTLDDKIDEEVGKLSSEIEELNVGKLPLNVFDFWRNKNMTVHEYGAISGFDSTTKEPIFYSVGDTSYWSGCFVFEIPKEIDYLDIFMQTEANNILFGVTDYSTKCIPIVASNAINGYSNEFFEYVAGSEFYKVNLAYLRKAGYTHCCGTFRRNDVDSMYMRSNLVAYEWLESEKYNNYELSAITKKGNSAEITLVNGFNVTKWNKYRVFVKSDIDIVSSSIRVGLGGNGIFDTITSEQLKNGYFTTFVSNYTGQSRVYLSAESTRENANIYCSIVNLSNPSEFGIFKPLDTYQENNFFISGFSLGVDGKYVASSDTCMHENAYIELDGNPIKAQFKDSVYYRFYDEFYNAIGNLGHSISNNLNVEDIGNAKYLKLGYASKVDIDIMNDFTSGIVYKVHWRNRNDVVDTVFNQRNLQLVACKNPIENGKRKYFSVLTCGDIHGDFNRFNRFIRLADIGRNNGDYGLFDLAYHCGDIIHNNQNEIPQNYYEGENNYNGVAIGGAEWFAESCTSKTPLIASIGNHDCGWTSSINAYTYDDLYNYFIKHTELANDSNKLYGYKDFEDYKIRVINLFDFDSNMVEISKNNGLSSLPTMIGFDRVYGQEQIEWFINTLKSVPTDYTVIITSHNQQLYRSGAIVSCSEFTDSTVDINNLYSLSFVAMSYRKSDNGGMGIVADIVKAYCNRETLNETYDIIGNEHWTPDANYTSVNVNADFTNASGEFGFYLCGHLHNDLAIKATMQGYENQTMIVITASTVERYQAKDFPKVLESDLQDCLLSIVVDTDNKKINLVKIGSDTNYNGEVKKDYSISY